MDHLSQAKRVIQIEIDEINNLLNRIDENFSLAIEILKSTISSVAFVIENLENIFELEKLYVHLDPSDYINNKS